MPLHLRNLTKKEKNLIANLLQDGNSYPHKIKRRARIIHLAAEGWIATELALQVGCHPNIARKWIKAFNNDGMEIMEAKRSPGSPSKISSRMKKKIIDAAMVDPSKLGLPFRRWSLNRLRGYLIGKSIVPSISRERLRQILMENGFAHKQANGWIQKRRSASKKGAYL